MYSVEFVLKIVTPLYMFGANQQFPELRTSEFKGMIRFWWRALKCSNNIPILKDEEEKIFGGTSEKSGKSEVGVIIKEAQAKSNIGENLQRDNNFNWYFNKQERILKGRNRGIGYLLYSVINKKYFKPSGTFKLILYSKKDENALKNAVAAFWCAINLGNFGSRARRGAGSISVVNIKGETYGLEFIPTGRNSEELAQWLILNVNKAAKIINPVDHNCTYSNIISSSFILSKQSFSKWSDALSDIGAIYMDFRKDVRSNIQSGIFGLPIVHSNKSKVIGEFFDKQNQQKEIERRTSPLLFKILECDGKYYWLILRFGGNYLPNTAELILMIKEKKEKGASVEKVLRREKPSWNLLDDFWREVSRDNVGERFFN